ncbi:MAG: MFS transporter [Sphingomonas sp.]|nr:MFS transporter [Sphingomonas sp.]
MGEPIATAGVAANGASYPSAGRGRYLVCVLTLAYAISFIDRQIFSLLVAPIRADLALSDTDLSLLQGFAFAVFYTGFGLPLGFLADRLNRRNLMIFGIVTWSLATSAAAFAHSYGFLFLARMLVGAGEAALSPAAYSMLSDSIAPDRRARALSIYASGIFLGSGLALMLGGSIASSADQLSGLAAGWGVKMQGWQIALLVAGLPGLPVTLLLATLPEPGRGERAVPADGRPSFALSLRLIRRRWLDYAIVIAALALLSTVFYGFFAWFPTIVMRRYGWSAARFGWHFGPIVLLLGPAGMWLGGWITDRRARAGRAAPALLPMGAGLVAVLVFGLALAAASDVTVALLLSAPLMLALALPSSLGPTFLQAITPNEARGLITALYLFGVNLIGLALGPTLVAWLSDTIFAGHLAFGLALTVIAVMPPAIVLILGLNAKLEHS